MTAQRFKVGIVGLQPGRSWAARGHIPALRALLESFEIAGVANTSLESSQAAAAAMGLPKAYANVAEMVSAPEIDIVTVTVKVAHHLEIVKAAIEAGTRLLRMASGQRPGGSRGTRRGRPGQGRVGRDWNASACRPGN